MKITIDADILGEWVTPAYREMLLESGATTVVQMHSAQSQLIDSAPIVVSANGQPLDAAAQAATNGGRIYTYYPPKNSDNVPAPWVAPIQCRAIEPAKPEHTWIERHPVPRRPWGSTNAKPHPISGGITNGYVAILLPDWNDDGHMGRYSPITPVSKKLAWMLDNIA